MEVSPCRGLDGNGHELETWNSRERSYRRTSGGRCAWLRAAGTADFGLGGDGGDCCGEGEEESCCGEHVGWEGAVNDWC